MMAENRTTVSIAGLHDGIALSEEGAELIATCLILFRGQAGDWENPEPRTLLQEVANILRGKRRDGSEPAAQPARHQLYPPSVDRRSIEDLFE